EAASVSTKSQAQGRSLPVVRGLTRNCEPFVRGLWSASAPLQRRRSWAKTSKSQGSAASSSRKTEFYLRQLSIRLRSCARLTRRAATARWTCLSAISRKWRECCESEKLHRRVGSCRFTTETQRHRETNPNLWS